MFSGFSESAVRSVLSSPQVGCLVTSHTSHRHLQPLLQAHSHNVQLGGKFTESFKEFFCKNDLISLKTSLKLTKGLVEFDKVHYIGPAVGERGRLQLGPGHRGGESGDGLGEQRDLSSVCCVCGGTVLTHRR